MLDTAGKLLQYLLKPRIQKSVEKVGGLSNKQHGFRPKISALAAIEDVIEGVKTAPLGTHYATKIVLLAALDVRKAFNSASCEATGSTGNHIQNPPAYNEDDHKLSTRPRTYQ